MLYSCTHMATVGVKGLITGSLGHSGYYIATCNSGLGLSQVWSLWPRPFGFLGIPVILCGCFNLFEFSSRFMSVSYFAPRLMHILILLNIVDQKSLSSFISGDWETLLCNTVCHCEHCMYCTCMPATGMHSLVQWFDHDCVNSDLCVQERTTVLYHGDIFLYPPLFPWSYFHPVSITSLPNPSSFFCSLVNACIFLLH